MILYYNIILYVGRENLPLRGGRGTNLKLVRECFTVIPQSYGTPLIATREAKMFGATGGDQSSSALSEVSAGFDEVSREQLDKIKARTMYNMVEPIDGDEKKLIYLTPMQATLLSREPASLKKMLGYLEIGEPQLVVNLLSSLGFSKMVKAYGPKGFDNFRRVDWAAGFVSERGAFLSKQEESEAIKQIELFMANVLIPLAVQTRAVVICCAVTPLCILSTCFLRVCARRSAKWGGKRPFTVLSVAHADADVYGNRNADAYWKELSGKSRNWMLRDAMILKYYQNFYADKGISSIPHKDNDLDRNATHFIIGGILCDKTGTEDYAPFDNFTSEMVRTLTVKLPSIAIKTANSNKFPNIVLRSALQASQSGTPTLFLDFRKRPTLSPTSDRGKLIEEAKEKFTEHCEALMANGTPETMESCTIAYFHDVLTGDGSHLTTEVSSRGNVRSKSGSSCKQPLHAAIREANCEDSDMGGQKINSTSTLVRATPQQIQDVADWIAHQYFKYAFEICDDEQKKGLEYYELFEDYLSALSSCGFELLSSEHTYHANVCDIEGISKLIDRLVRLDRLPKENPVEGLLLLRSAWCDYDVAMVLASRYKCWCKLMFVLQLILSWLVVALSAASTFIETSTFADVTNISREDSYRLSFVIVESVFGVSLALSMLLSLASLVDSKNKWRALRSGAGSLQATIWMYRTRVGPFEIDESTEVNFAVPEDALMKALTKFREDLITGANLGSSNFHRKHPRSVYKHFQFEGQPEPNGDDFHSPLQPQLYIQQRVEPALNFYALRIPRYNRCGKVYTVLIVLLSIMASVLARYKFVSLVVMATTGSAMVTSWVEFTDLSSKNRRYTRTVNTLKNILDWWSSISDVRKASRDAIAHLIMACESTIAEEQIGWTSVNAKQSAQLKANGKSPSNEGKVRVVPS